MGRVKGQFSLVSWLRDMSFWWQLVVAGIAVALAAVMPRLFPNADMPRPGVPSPMPIIVPTATTLPASETATVHPTSSPTPTPSVTPTLVPPNGGVIYAVTAYVNRVGWVVEGEEGNHFGDSFIYAGVRNGRVYHGAFQFDLSFLPPGTLVHYAAVELTGLDDSRLGRNGRWSLQMLAPAADPEWPLHGFDEIHRAGVAYTLSPTLSDDLRVGQANVWVLNAAQRAELEKRIGLGVISFRLDGPSSGDDNLFAWDSGYGPQSRGQGPVLRIAVTPPLGTVVADLTRRTGIGAPTPTFVIVTSAPTPGNILTAAAVALTATAWATAVGTPTPLPANWVTPIIVTATPTPVNRATAEARAALATARAVLTGTPTPTPANVWTATPTPTWVVITPAPTPQNPLTAVAIALTATAQAATVGTPTPLPPNWVTPIIVTATPTPANRATAEARAALATAQAVLLGPPTPTPANLWVVTPTPTPLLIYMWELPPVPPPTWTPTALPRVLEGKVAFLSNRRGEAAVYVMNTDGRGVALLTDRWAYDLAAGRQQPDPAGRGYLSPDGRYVLYTVGEVGHRQVWIMNADGSDPRNISNNRFDEYAPIWLRSDR